MSLKETDGGVAEVEAVGAEHAQEDGEEERRLEVVAVRPIAGHVAEEGAARVERDKPEITLSLREDT